VNYFQSIIPVYGRRINAGFRFSAANCSVSVSPSNGDQLATARGAEPTRAVARRRGLSHRPLYENATAAAYGLELARSGLSLPSLQGFGDQFLRDINLPFGQELTLINWR